MAGIIFLLAGYLTTVGYVDAYNDPGVEMMACVDGGKDINECAKQTLENFRAVMETGVPELGLPRLDPINLQQINFNFFNLTTEFLDVDIFGFKKFILKKSNIDKKKRTWDVNLALPNINAVGMYKMYGSIPPSIDLGLSTGDERFSADSVLVRIRITFGEKGKNLEVTDLELNINLAKIKLELECLFPKDGKCCPEKYLKSCNAVLAKTVLRFINRDGKNFVKEFQPEIAKQIRPIFTDYFNKAIATVESRYLIE